MAKSADAFRTISEVAEWLDTPAHVLRFWESKFPQIKPVKRAGGRRYYRPADMELIGGIKKLLHDDGMTIKGVQKVLREQGVRYVSGLGQGLGDSAPDVEAKAGPVPDAAPAKPAENAPEAAPPADPVVPFRPPQDAEATPEEPTPENPAEQESEQEPEPETESEQQAAPGGLPSFLTAGGMGKSADDDTPSKSPADKLPEPEDAPGQAPESEPEPEPETADEAAAPAEAEEAETSASDLPAFLRRPAAPAADVAPSDTALEPESVAEPEPETALQSEPGPGTAPTRLGADIAADPKDDDIPAKGGPLTRATRSRHLSPEARPLLDRLRKIVVGES